MNDGIRGPFINHPIALVKNLGSIFIIGMIIGLNFIGDGIPVEAFLGVGAVCVPIIIVVVMFWKTTTIEFGDTDMTVRRNFISRKTRVIPYSRIASVNVTRSVYDRIAGTETLSFNVNSAVNAAAAEAVFTFKKCLADEIRDFVYSHTFDDAPADDHDDHESIVNFTTGQVIAHSFLSQPTWQLAWSALFLLFSIYSLVNENNGGFAVSTMLFLIQGVVPTISIIIRYHGFRMYRDGDTVCVQYGAIQNYRSEFDVSRINALRLRRPLLARLTHQACLEAEVVGIDATSDVTSMLCLLMPDAEAERLISEVLPEFDCGIRETAPPKAAWRGLACQAMVVNILLMAVMSVPCLMAAAIDPIEGVDESLMPLVRMSPEIAIALIAFYTFWRGWRTSLLFRIGLGDDMMMMRNGLLDREWVVVRYERVQVVSISNNMITRHFGISRCSIGLLSTTGSKSIRSGYFDTCLLEQIPEHVMSHIDYGDGNKKS